MRADELRPIPTLQDEVLRACTEAEKVLVGKEVKLLSRGARKFRGRAGVVTHVMPSWGTCAGDTLLALVYVWNLSEAYTFLNSRRETRSYWPLRDLELTGRQFKCTDRGRWVLAP